MPTPAGTLIHRLTIPGVGSTFAPGDPDPLAGTDYYITSKRSADHPWLADDGSGRPDLNGDGQRLEPAIGHVTDGEYQVRVIDVAGPVPVCGTAVVIPEGDAGLNLGPNSFVAGANMWHRYEANNTGTSVDGVPPLPGPGSIEIQIIGGEPGFGGFILFGSDTYNGYIWRVLDGTEGGGAGFVPGRRYAFRCRVTWGLDTGPGNLYIETIGGADPYASTPGSTTNRTSFLNGTYDFWTVDPSLNTSVFNGYISAVADSSGEIEFRFGAENYGGSCNVVATINDMEVVECTDSYVGALYTTGWLADDDARQQLLGRAAYLEESYDGGATWPTVIYTGFVKSIVMQESLTYVFTLGDAGRGRRVSPAWKGLNPIEDFS